MGIVVISAYDTVDNDAVVAVAVAVKLLLIIVH